MRQVFDSSVKGHLSYDDQKKVRYILHSQEFWQASGNAPRTAALEYLDSFAGIFQIDKGQLKHAYQELNYLEPQSQGIEYRFSDEKNFFDSSTLAYEQTFLNVPVWGAGLTVTLKQNPARVLLSCHMGLDGLNAKLPDARKIEGFKRIFALASTLNRGPVSKGETTIEEDKTTPWVHGILRRPAGKRKGARKVAEGEITGSARLNRGRFYIYRYSADERLPKPHGKAPNPKANFQAENDELHPTLPLPPVPGSIKDGQDYLVAELLFTLSVSPYGRLNWRALVDVETGSILYLRALVDGVDGLVYTYDPITSTGSLTNTADQNNAVLNPFRDNVTLQNLNAPSGGVQSLTGTYVRVADDSAPTVAAPTEPSGTDFDFNARTNDFAAVSAYYHPDRLFALIEDLGFPRATYFDGTTFPVHIDHRSSIGTTTGIEVNAFCGGDAEGNGIGLVGYCLGDTTDTANPLGRSVDKWVHWHEIGGHGILWDHVNSPNFGFAHSAGDGLAALQNDPESALRALPERFRYAPFRAGLDRWFNRDVAAGWGWGGSNDLNGYNSEQILATTHFRLYRSLGGDSNDVARRWFASRAATYLILRAVGTLTPGTNPGNALGLCNALMAVDLLNWTSEGLFGGAYNKVIRWAYEKQGLFQASGAVPPFSTAGAPPAVDVYIDDGRAGEYQFQAVHWNNTSVWNRNAADGMTAHQNAVREAVNYGYVKLKNRGTSVATGVVVKGYHCLPGAGLTWKTDFTQMEPLAGITVASIGANNSEEVIVGPFSWTPNENVYGHDCMLMVASATGDPSNVDNFTVGETIEEWRLVPNDNNIGQRNVTLVTGGEGTEGLMRSLDGVFFLAGNPFRRKADMELKVELPRALVAGGWKVEFPGITNRRFELQSGEKRKVTIKPVAGKTFGKDQFSSGADRDIHIILYANGIVMGGMTYRIDPDVIAPAGGTGSGGSQCLDKAKALLDCLKIGDGQVKKVCVKKVTLDIDFDNDCRCD